jgi:lipoprotein NlpD
VAQRATKSGSQEAVKSWRWPVRGKIVGHFGTTGGKGIDIAGRRGTAIKAAAPGHVVYSGSGLRGYGKLIIVKHNKRYLSAYAHNERLHVKEGDTVKGGQRIAEMGDSDAKSVRLHFEIRRDGQPVNPTRYLPR